MAVNPKKLRPYDEPPRRKRPLIPSQPDSAAAGFLVLAFLWLAAATGIGVLWVAMQLFPDQLTLTFQIPMPIGDPLALEISPSTVTSGFSNALVFGWLSNAAFAAILFVTPRILGTRLADDAMAFGGLAVWNIAVASGLALVYLPDVAATGLLAEFPLPVDGLLLLGLLIITGVFFRTLLASRQRLPYVSVWFFGLALLALLGAYTLGAGIPLLNLGEVTEALVNAFVARAIVAYWVLGVALGALFYVVPRATGNPLYSRAMALLAWLLWAAFAGLSAVGALVDPSVPYAVTTIGSAGSILLVAPVVLAVANLALSIQGRWSLALTPGTVGLALAAMGFLLSTAMLEAIGALRSVQLLVRGTEWEMGVWIFATLGSGTFALFAILEHAAPRVFRRDWRGSPLTDVQLWATFAGTALAGLTLMAAGIAHGSLLTEGAPPEEITATLAWFWVVAGSGLGLVALGGLAGLVNLFLLYTTGPHAEYVAPSSGDRTPTGDRAAAAAGH